MRTFPTVLLTASRLELRLCRDGGAVAIQDLIFEIRLIAQQGGRFHRRCLWDFLLARRFVRGILGRFFGILRFGFSGLGVFCRFLPSARSRLFSTARASTFLS
jgi:hypothetical protein